jgi:putative ABC transport system permease protein
MPIPLAWNNFVYNKARMLASVGGVAFAVVLMFVEMGFSNGLYDSETYFIKMMNADLFLVSRFKDAVVPKLPFPKQRVIQARAVPGVEGVYPVYVDEYRALLKNSRNGKEHPILIVGFNPDDPVWLVPEISRQASKLKVADTALIDTKSRDFYGDLKGGVDAELTRRRIKIVGTFPLGPDFRVDGNILVSDVTFTNSVTPAGKAKEESRVEFGLVDVKPGHSLRTVRAALRRSLPEDVLILTKQELTDKVINFWANSKPIGFVFGTGTFVGFLIGVTICYQILFTDIVDHLPQYATLKAIGYSNLYLMKIVLQQAIYLGTIGFFPGLLCTLGIYSVLQSLSGILMQLNPQRIVAVFVLTLVMCSVSAAIAIRKVVSSDPAEVF